MRRCVIFIVVACSLIWAALPLNAMQMIHHPFPPPTVTSVTPNSGPADTTQNVTITGTDFEPGATVQLVHEETSLRTDASNINVGLNPTFVTPTATRIMPVRVKSICHDYSSIKD